METTQKIHPYPGLEQIPIIAVSANAFTEQQIEALSKGVVDYITKPIDLDKLITILSQYLY